MASPQAEAAFEGARVLDDGGNAADATVTAALVQGVVDPHRSGIGGFGCATTLFGSGGSARALSLGFHGRAGSRARADTWADRYESAAPDGFGYLVSDRSNDVGYASITVPGMVAGLAEIHRRYGKLSWRDLVERAVPYADEGFLVHPELAEFWIRPGLYGRVSTRDRLGLTEEGRRICFTPSGEPYRAGEVFRQPALAETYRRLAADGPESFYRGDLARRIAEDWERNGALVTAEDLASYEVEAREPLRGRHAGLEVLTTPLPGGGVALLQALALFSTNDLARLGHNTPEAVHRLGLILQAVGIDRVGRQGDPAHGSPPDEVFLTREYLSGLERRGSAGAPAAPEAPDTTQLSIIDGWGNAVSFSHSLGYNSGVFTPGLGFLYNNCMSGFDPRPGHANSIAPGKARSTAVAETLIVEGREPRIVLGSPGGARITAGLAQVIINRLDFGMELAEAVLHPRFDAYGPGTLLLESRFPPAVAETLRQRGWRISQSPKPFGVVGRVYAVEALRAPPGGTAAGIDPGAPGAAFRQR